MKSGLALPLRGSISRVGLFFSAAAFALLCAASAGSADDWQVLSPGLELKFVPIRHLESSPNARITILRIDAHLWELQAIGSSSTGEKASYTAREWSEGHELTAAINAGMFKTDGKTHVGYMRFRDHTNNGKVNNYLSVAAFDPHDTQSHAPFRIFDLDGPQVAVESILKDYDSAIQNLRLIKRPGTNQWSQQTRMWSEAALGEDEAGRVLFILCRKPLSMHDLNDELLAAGIGLVAAQHLEGGPEAQLYVHAGNFKLEEFGSYETGFQENDTNAAPWPIPNILGVRPRKTPGQTDSTGGSPKPERLARADNPARDKAN